MSAPRPFVLVNMAMTADGKIATANRRIAHFGSARDQAHLYELRATADAVLCGARTAEAPGVTLGPGPRRFQARRLRQGLSPCHLRVIVSGSGTVNPAASVFRSRVSPLLVLTSTRVPARRLARLKAAADAVHAAGETAVDFAAALRWLRQEWNVRRLLVEGGGEVNAALWAAGLVDELHLTICPFVFGGRAAPTIAEGPGTPALEAARRLRLTAARRHGAELFLVYRVRA